MKVNQTFDEFNYPEFSEKYFQKTGNILSETEDTIELIDGSILSSSGHYLTYDNNLDETLPNLLIGIRNPDAEERRKGTVRRKYFPRKLNRFRKKSIKFWVEDENHLSEILSAYPHLSFGIKLGKRSGTELLSLVLFFNWKVKNNLHRSILGREIFEIAEKRCKANAYQGDWSTLAKILQLQNSPRALLGFIRENFSKRSLYGNFLPNGEKIYNEAICFLSLYPVKTPQRKRGYSDKGSRRDPSKTKNLPDQFGTETVTRDDLFLTEQEANLHFLYGMTNPTKWKTVGSTEREYLRRQAKQAREERKKEQRRIKKLTGPVIIIRSSDQK